MNKSPTSPTDNSAEVTLTTKPSQFRWTKRIASVVTVLGGPTLTVIDPGGPAGELGLKLWEGAWGGAIGGAFIGIAMGLAHHLKWL